MSLTTSALTLLLTAFLSKWEVRFWALGYHHSYRFWSHLDIYLSWSKGVFIFIRDLQNQKSLDHSMLFTHLFGIATGYISGKTIGTLFLGVRRGATLMNIGAVIYSTHSGVQPT
jgi:hypothetical protein